MLDIPVMRLTFWQLFTHGTLRAQFDANNKIEMLDLVINSHNEYIPRSQLQPAEVDQKQSPKVSKNMNKRAQQKQQPAVVVPESMVTNNGVPTAVMSFLEVAETMSQMQVLFQYSQQNPHMSPPEALRNLVNNFQSQNAGLSFPPGMSPALQQAPNPRPPTMNGPSQFASPSMAHLGLPGAAGSPHLAGSAHASPAQAHLAGPMGLMQQGPNGSAGTSATTSPNISNKRRRQSTVQLKQEDDNNAEAGASGAAKVKPSPRIGGKRQKGTA